MAENVRLSYLEWQALLLLYRNRDRTASPLSYIGLKTTIAGLIAHQPPLVRWVGKASDHMVHITDEGIAFYEADR